jgi:hypothetical protein
MAALITGVPYRALEKLNADAVDAVWQTVGAYIGKRNPLEFYNQFTAEDDEGEEKIEGGFTGPAAMPETMEK